MTDFFLSKILFIRLLTKLGIYDYVREIRGRHARKLNKKLVSK